MLARPMHVATFLFGESVLTPRLENLTVVSEDKRFCHEYIQQVRRQKNSHGQRATDKY